MEEGPRYREVRAWVIIGRGVRTVLDKPRAGNDTLGRGRQWRSLRAKGLRQGWGVGIACQFGRVHKGAVVGFGVVEPDEAEPWLVSRSKKARERAAVCRIVGQDSREGSRGGRTGVAPVKE